MCKKRKSQCSKSFTITMASVRVFFKIPLAPFSIPIYQELLQKHLLKRWFYFQTIFSIKMSAHVQASDAKKVFSPSRLIRRRFCTCDTPQRWHLLWYYSRYRGQHFTFHTFSRHTEQFNPFIYGGRAREMRTSRSQPQVRRCCFVVGEPNSRCGVCDKK
jgi:hypothetical protein